jgi:type II secretory pathway pseudopilin PulG
MRINYIKIGKNNKGGNLNMKKTKRQNGITLVALVITIIILLILATISIQSLTNTGLFKKAQEAKEKTQNATENQAKMLNEYEDELNKYISGTVKETFKGTTVADAIQYGDVLNKDDNTELHDAYGNKIVVPAGFKITNDATTVDKGIVIEDVTSGATAGSQFVWVPVGKIYTDTTRTDANSKTINLNRYTFNENGNPTAQGENIISNYYQELSSSDKGTTVSKNITDFKNSVSTNGGYYIGRYEARTTTPRTSADNALTQITEKVTDHIYNYVTQVQSAQLSQHMYNTSKFTSDLINSYAWDTAIIFIQKCTNQTKYSRQNSLNTGSIAQTGTTIDKQCNIFDMASNVFEWTTETSNYSDYPCVYRSGYCYDSNCYTSNQYYGDTSLGNAGIGFRPLLYL